MRLLAISLALVAVVCQLVHARREVRNPHLLATAMRISRLDHEIEGLKHEIEEAAKIDPLGFILEMHARLNQIEG